jgi:lipopolysaccharide transport system ATP-binding protein
MTQPIIEVDHVTKEFILGQPPSVRQTAGNLLKRMAGRPVEAPAPFKALDDISFQVAPGEVLGIIGHNGAGKSTLLKILARISEPTKGTVHVRGRVAPLIEVGAGLMPDMTGRENIFLNASILGMKKDEIRGRFDEIVDFAEIAEFVDTPVKRYSSGMKVKLGFSIATSVASEVLIVDEVLAVGDLSFQQKCIERMEKLIRGEGRTVLIVGHNIRQLQRICSRVMLLDHGHVTQDGLPQNVCGLYFQEAQERNLARIQRDRGSDITPQQDSGVVKVESIELLDDRGAPVSALCMHEPVKVCVTFTCLRELKRPEVVIGLQTSDFVHVLSVSNALPDVRPDLTPGTYKLTCRISDIPLRPLSYTLRLGVLDQYRHLLWYAENIMPATVVAGRYDITRLPESGLVDMPADWAFEEIGSASPYGDSLDPQIAEVALFDSMDRK